MALTQANAISRLQAIEQNGQPAVKALLQRLLDEHRHLGRDPADIDARVDTALDKPPATLSESEIRRIVGWLNLRWEELPPS